jgi:hypothetical protein
MPAIQPAAISFAAARFSGLVTLIAAISSAGAEAFDGRQAAISLSPIFADAELMPRQPPDFSSILMPLFADISTGQPLRR